MTTATINSPTARTWRRDAQRLCEAIAPEHPAYVLGNRSVAAADRTSSGCLGYTSNLIDLRMEPLLRRQKKWRGRGFACVVSSVSGRRPMSPNEKLAVVLHEFAHFVAELAANPALLAAASEREARKPYQALAKTLQKGLEEFADLPKTFDEFLESLAPPLREHILTVWPAAKREALAARMFPPVACVSPWQGHELPFVRAGLHVMHRASLLGFVTTPAAIGLAGSRYGLSAPQKYLASLADEPRQREREDLLAVLRSPSPASAVQLFDRDTGR